VNDKQGLLFRVLDRTLLARRSTARLTAFDPAAAGLATGVSGRKVGVRAFFDVNGIAAGPVIENDGVWSPYLDTGSKAVNNTTAQNHVRAGNQNADALPAGSCQLAATTVKRDAAAGDPNSPIPTCVGDAVVAPAQPGIAGNRQVVFWQNTLLALVASIVGVVVSVVTHFTFGDIENTIAAIGALATGPAGARDLIVIIGAIIALFILVGDTVSTIGTGAIGATSIWPGI